MAEEGNPWEGGADSALQRLKNEATDVSVVKWFRDAQPRGGDKAKM